MGICWSSTILLKLFIENLSITCHVQYSEIFLEYTGAGCLGKKWWEVLGTKHTFHSSTLLAYNINTNNDYENELLSDDDLQLTALYSLVKFSTTK